jgi:two-component system response regulator PilR (NtrC family)
LHRAVALHPESSILDARAILRSAPGGSALKERVPASRDSSDLEDRMAHTEREEILRALAKAGGVRKRAAEILGVSYRGLGKKMARLGIRGG